MKQKLKQLPNFVNWNENKEKPKAPINSKTGGNAQNNNSLTWSDYETAKRRSNFIGFEFGNSDVIGIDVDHCVNSKGEFSQLAKYVLDTMKSSAELSQSGTGLHIYASVKDKSKFQNRKIVRPEKGFEEQVIEFYCDNHYFCMTENWMNDFEVEARQIEAEKIFAEFFPKKEPKKKISFKVRERNTAVFESESEFILDEMLSKPRNRALYEGNFENYPSQNEADLALCGVLAWYFNKDAGKVDFYFRQSGLMRDKWDEVHDSYGNTYGEMTIYLAISNCQGCFESEIFSKHGRELYKYALAQLLNYSIEKALEKYKVKASNYLGEISREKLNQIWENAKKSKSYQAKLKAEEALKNNPEDVKEAYEEFEERMSVLNLSKEEKQKAWQGAKKSEKKRTQEQQKETRERIFKQPLTTLAVTQTLENLGLVFRFNVITSEAELIGEYPIDTPFLSPSYFNLPEEIKRRKKVVFLPEFLFQLLRAEGFTFSDKQLERILNDIATSNPYNPLKEMFTAKKWDGVDRIAELQKIMGIQQNPLYCSYVKKWLIQATAMACNDEGKYNNNFVLMLQGKQGIGKTEFFRNLAFRNEAYYKEGNINTNDKDSMILASSRWIFEIGEANATFQREQAELKSYLTFHFDTFRRPYGKNNETLPRHTCFGGTVNPDRFLRDIDGGSRRWAVVRVEKIDSEKLRALPLEWYEMLWRQAYQLFCENNEAYRLTDAERLEQEQENLSAVEFLEFEQDILERLNFDAPLDKWEYHSASWVVDMAELPKTATRKVGKALSRIEKYDKRVIKKRSNTSSVYLLPPKKESLHFEQPKIEPVELLAVEPSEAELRKQRCDRIEREIEKAEGFVMLFRDFRKEFCDDVEAVGNSFKKLLYDEEHNSKNEGIIKNLKTTIACIENH